MILDQLRDYCECVKEATDEDVAELISVVSMATGWMRSPCENFLLDDRTEVIDLPSCSDCPIEFEPYYHPFDPSSMKFTLVKIKGVEETEEEITDFGYISSEKKFRVNALTRCGCTVCECGCPTEYKLKAEYSAGYTEIPECLLPVFCNLLEVIQAKNDCDCTCECGSNEEAQYDRYGNLITQQVKYKSGDVVSVFLETDLAKMLVQDYKNQLGMLSVIRQKRVWGLVV